MALKIARPLATQKGPVLPLVVSAPPKSAIIGGNTTQERKSMIQ